MSSASLVRLSGTRPQPASSDIQITRAMVLGSRTWIAFRYDAPEVSRRAEFGLGPVLAWDLLDTLMDLPAGLPVPTTALTPSAQRRVDRAPEGVARISPNRVIRDLVPALTPLLAIVVTRDWDTGLVRASRFGSYCRRMVVGPRDSVSGETANTAARLGIGLAVRGERGATEVTQEAPPVDDWQPTTAWWRFCEVIFDHAARRDI